MEIIAVDDIKQNRYLLQKLLEGYGYAVETASNGVEALEKARESLPDMIITDVLMPGMDGFQLCRTLKNILSESRSRINTMALIHSQLYGSENLSAINMKGFMDKLLVQLLQIHSVPETKITPIVHVADYPRPISIIAIPLGLIVNELLSNAFKHAFVNRKQGKIEVSLSAEKGKIGLTVSDDGVGLPEGFDVNTSKTLGLHVVKILAEEQLEGNLEVISKDGTTIKIIFEL